MQATRQVAAALAVIAAAFVVAVAIVGFGTGERLRANKVELMGLNPRQMTILRIAKSLHSDKVPKKTALKTASALTQIESLCGVHGGGNAGSYDRLRKRADKNWWAAIHAFATAEEVKKAVIADPDHVHVMIYVAPGWCHWSQKQIQELQGSFDDLGESGARVHLIDVDDPANEELVEFQGITSFPSVVVVQGNNILGRSSGFKDFDTIHDMAFAGSKGMAFDSTFPH